MNKERYLEIKKSFDYALSGIGLIFAIPIILAASVAILIDDPEGGPIYSQMRVGKDGVPFRMYKLRTMYKNADKHVYKVAHMNEMDGPVFKIKDDPRITRVGKFLRKSSIDELPQLFNVFFGDMSLVGPRPPLPNEVEKYNEKQKKRLSVTPGLTCYWQIAKNRNDISFDKWVDMDLKYIRDMSIRTDISILFRTIGAVLRMSGR